jgi:hypothetical protein
VCEIYGQHSCSRSNRSTLASLFLFVTALPTPSALELRTLARPTATLSSPPVRVDSLSLCCVCRRCRRHQEKNSSASALKRPRLSPEELSAAMGRMSLGGRGRAMPQVCSECHCDDSDKLVTCSSSWNPLR